MQKFKRLRGRYDRLHGLVPVNRSTQNYSSLVSRSRRSTADRWEPDDGRLSRPVLREPGGEIPPGYSPNPDRPSRFSRATLERHIREDRCVIARCAGELRSRPERPVTLWGVRPADIRIARRVSNGEVEIEVSLASEYDDPGITGVAASAQDLERCDVWSALRQLERWRATSHPRSAGNPRRCGLLRR